VSRIASGPPYDLILKSGTVLAPGDGLAGRLDLALSNGRIAAIGPAIDGEARRVVDVRGGLVTPGLIDLHTHVDFGMRTEGVNARGADPDLIGVQAGVPTLVDAGTTGPYVFGGFRNYVIDRARTRVLCFLHAGRGGITIEPDVRFEEDVNLDAFAKAVEYNRDVIVGVKTRLIGPGLRTLGVRILELSKAAAREVGLPLMVHTGDHFSLYEGSQEVTRAALRLIDAGDIIEHTYTSLPGGMMETGGRIVPELVEAIQRGAFISAASGGAHLSFRVARAMLDKGIKPSFIASDLNSINYRRGCFSFTEIMSQFLALGLSLEEVVRLSTIEPARVIHREEALGRLRVGADADISVLDVVEGRWEFTDCDGERLVGDESLVPVLTLRAGQPVVPDWGPHPWGWLPEPGGYARTLVGERPIRARPA
jgi:dihydroorotase